jgi:hypothetical protein
MDSMLAITFSIESKPLIIDGMRAAKITQDETKREHIERGGSCEGFLEQPL